MSEDPSPEVLFQRALEIGDPAERAAFLDRECAGKKTLRKEVDALLAAFGAAGILAEAGDLSPVTDEQSGDRIGNYKLLELIGEGGFGRVWMAEQEQPMRRRVALKIVKLGMDTRDVLARFEAERQALALMDHPNIARVFDGGATAGGRPYFAMELVRGLPITEFCDARRMPPNERLELFRHVCLAVQHAHQKGIIHRDLKPSNILVTVQDDQPVPKVIDFGVAKALQAQLTEKTLFTRFNQWLGTPAYMSPEQAGLGGLDVDTRSDIYSLGAVLYELLTGRTPFDDRKLREMGYDAILHALREEDPPKASTRLTSLPREELQSIASLRGRTPEKLGHAIKGELDWILLKALERDRTRRYGTANALAKDLERFVKGEPVGAAPPSFAYLAGKLIRKRRKAASVAASIILLVIAGSIVSTVFGLKAHTAEQAATQRLRQEREALATMKLRQARQLCENGEVDSGLHMFAEALTLARQAEAGSLEEACLFNLAAWWPEMHALIQMIPHPKRVDCVAVSPDGKVVASACEDGRVRFWDLETGQPAAPDLVHPAGVNVVTFEPQGTGLYTGSADGKARHWDFPTRERETAKREFLHVAADANKPAWGYLLGVSSVSVSHDGLRLATGGYNGWVHVWNVADPLKPINSKKLGEFVTWASFAPHDEDSIAATHSGWRLDSWNWKRDLAMSPKSVGATPWHFDFHPSKRHVAVGLMQHQLAGQFDTATGNGVGKAMKHFDAVGWVEYSPDGSRILTASADQKARVWDSVTCNPIGSILSHPTNVTCGIWSPSGNEIVTAGVDGTVRVWRATRGGRIKTLQEQMWVRDVAFSPDSALVASVSAGNQSPRQNLRVWNATTGQPVISVKQDQDSDPCVAFDRSGMLVYSSRPAGIGLYDVVTGLLINESPQEPLVKRLARSPCGEFLASANNHSPGVTLWHAATLKPIGATLPSGGTGDDGRFSQHLKQHHTAPFAFGHDGRSLFIGNFTGDLQCWDTSTAKPLGAAKRHSSRITAVAVSSDGKLLALGGKNHRIRLREWPGWQPVGAEMQHSGRVTAVTFAPDRRLLFTSSADGTARVWHVPTGLPVGPVLRHENVINTVECSPDGRLAATASDDRTAKIWKVPRLNQQETEGVEACLEALTGITSSDGDTVRFLSIDEWAATRSKNAGLVKRLLAEPVGETPPADGPRGDLIAWRQSKSPEATAAIEETMVDEASRIRAIELFRRQDTPEAARAIGRLCAKGSNAVRLRAYAALEQMKTPAAGEEFRRQIVASDDFSGEAKLEWKILGNSPDFKPPEPDRGILTIRAQDGDFSGVRKDFRDVYLIPNPAPGHDFQVSTCVVGFTPTIPRQQVGLLCWNDEDNYLKLSYEAFEPQRQQVAFWPELNGQLPPRIATFTIAPGIERLWLRLTRAGDTYAFASSVDEVSFVTHGYQIWKGEVPKYVGFVAMARGGWGKSGVEIDASFDSFEVVTLSPAGSESPPTDSTNEK